LVGEVRGEQYGAARPGAVLSELEHHGWALKSDQRSTIGGTAHQILDASRPKLAVAEHLLLEPAEQVLHGQHQLLVESDAGPTVRQLERQGCRSPISFDGSAKTVGSSGIVSWSWPMESKGSGGTATVTCSLHGQIKSATASFGIA